MHPEPFKRGTERLRALLRHADRRTRDLLRQRLRVQPGAAGARRRDPRTASSAPTRCWPASSGASSCASGTRRPSRRPSPSTARCRPSIPTRSPTTSWSRTCARCRDHHAAMITQHMRFTAGAMIPTGDFLAHVGDWTGLRRAELLGLMRGSAPVSARRLRRARAAEAAIADDPEARVLLASDGDPARGARGSCARSTGDAGAAVSGYLDLVGYRLLDGFDIAEPRRARSCPTRCCGRSGSPLEGRDHEGADVSELDRRGPRAGAGGAPGRVRRAARRGAPDLPAARRARRLQRHLGLGHHAPRRARGRRRVAGRGRIDDAEHIVDAEPRRDVRAGQRHRRAVGRRARRRARVPGHARPPRTRRRSSGPAAAAARPVGPAARPSAASCARPASRSASSSAAPRRSTRRRAARPRRESAASTKGRAPPVAGPSEFGRIEQGDVLVTESTTEAFNILLPLLGAIVTDNGGLLSHSAIVAREYGIPGVVGTREATERIADGTACVAASPARSRCCESRPVARERERPGCDRADDLARGRPARRGDRRRVYGSKAVGLGDAVRDGLPVPPGVALVGRRSSRPSRARTRTTIEQRVEATLRGCARRSPSARPRSTRTARTRASPASTSRCSTSRRSTTCRRALREIWWSANSDSAITYRQRVGLFTRPSVGVVVQSLLDPDGGGVMFTQNPVTGADERLIEATWGLGEAVVAGLVIPDTFRLDRAGEVLERKPGLQADRDPLAAPTAAPSRRTVDADARRSAHASTTTMLAQLGDLARHCEEVYGTARDIEWAVEDGTLYLLQCRAVTTTSASRPPAIRRPRSAEHDPVDVLSSVPLFFADLGPRRGRADRLAVQGAPLRQGRDRDHGGLRRRRVLHHRLRRGERHASAATRSPRSARATTSARSR